MKKLKENQIEDRIKMLEERMILLSKEYSKLEKQRDLAYKELGKVEKYKCYSCNKIIRNNELITLYVSEEEEKTINTCPYCLNEVYKLEKVS